MRREDGVRLNAHALARRIEARGLKQYWIAEAIGVDRKTVSRWLTGKTPRIARDNLERLAEILACSAAELSVSDEADLAATREEQRAAAALLVEQDLVQILSPTDNWRLAETLIRATFEPNLPRQSLGHLYNLLSIAAWRQGHYGDAVDRASRAREIAIGISDRAMERKALHNLSVVESLCGRVDAAIRGFRTCASEPDAFANARDHGAALSNLAMLYASAERFEESIATQLEAIAVFETIGADYNLSIALIGLGCARVEAGEHAMALEDIARARRFAERCGYRRGVDCAPLYIADAMSLSGEIEAAAKAVREALQALEAHAVYDLGCRESAARVLRRAGDFAGAARELDIATARAERFHELLGRLLHERSRLARVQGDAKTERAARLAGNEAFRRAGLDVRARTEPLAEHGARCASANAASPGESADHLQARRRAAPPPERAMR